MKVELTQDQRDLVIVALTKWLEEVRREYEDGIDVGANVSGLRVRRDLIKETIEAVKGNQS